MIFLQERQFCSYGVSAFPFLPFLPFLPSAEKRVRVTPSAPSESAPLVMMRPA